MQLLTTILLMWTIAIAPLCHTALSAQCECTNDSGIALFNAVQGEFADDCCSPQSSPDQDRSSDNDDLPCNQGDCPSSCCMVNSQPVTFAYWESVTPSISFVGYSRVLTDTGHRSPAHLDKLKRPPKSV